MPRSKMLRHPRLQGIYPGCSFEQAMITLQNNGLEMYLITNI